VTGRSHQVVTQDSHILPFAGVTGTQTPKSALGRGYDFHSLLNYDIRWNLCVLSSAPVASTVSAHVMDHQRYAAANAVNNRDDSLFPNCSGFGVSPSILVCGARDLKTRSTTRSSSPGLYSFISGFSFRTAIVRAPQIPERIPDGRAPLGALVPSDLFSASRMSTYAHSAV
jgi:hypothetical protein